MAKVDGTMKKFIATDPEKRDLVQLQNLEKIIRKGPMHTVYQACESAEASPNPPNLQIIKCMQMIAETYASKAGEPDDKYFMKASQKYEECIDLCAATESTRSEAVSRLSRAQMMIRWSQKSPSLEADITSQIHWALGCSRPLAVEDLIPDFLELQRIISNRDLQRIRSAMSTTTGYNFGTSSSDHWYQCRNGHPYFIGECGRAMEQARCPECYEPIGGLDHILVETNSHWNDINNV